MEKNEKGISSVLIVLLVIVGISLVGFCVWYGINYFKGDEKPNVPDNQTVEPAEGDSYKELLNKKINGNKLEFISYFYRDSKEIIKNILDEKKVTCYKTSYENKTLTINYEDDQKYKVSGVDGEIKCAYMHGTEDGTMTAYVLTKDGNLYTTEIDFDVWNSNKNKAFSLTKIGTNISSIVSKDIGVMDEVIPVTYTYFLDNSNNYYSYGIFIDNDKESFRKVDKPDGYTVNGINFYSSNIKNNKLFYENIEVSSVFLGYSNDEDYQMYYRGYIIGKDNYLYGVTYEAELSKSKFEKAVDKEIKKIDIKGTDEKIISIEFE